MSKQITAKAKRMPKPKGIPKGKLQSLHVEPADNGGFTVNSRHEVPQPSKPRKGSMAMMPDYDAGSHQAVFGNPQDTLSHIGSLIGASGGGSAPAAASPSPAPAASDNDGDEE